jgi:hypothetical protein
MPALSAGEWLMRQQIVISFLHIRLVAVEQMMP